LTILTDTTQREISLLLAGMRITFTVEEARHLARELASGLERISEIDRTVDSFELMQSRVAPTAHEVKPAAGAAPIRPGDDAGVRALSRLSGRQSGVEDETALRR
jgi:hypothetical protein